MNINKYIIPCPSCLNDRLYSSYKTYSRALKQKDRVCHKCSAKKRKIITVDKKCIDCGVVITNISNVLRCKSCAAKNNNSKPEIRQKISKSF